MTEKIWCPKCGKLASRVMPVTNGFYYWHGDDRAHFVTTKQNEKWICADCGCRKTRITESLYDDSRFARICYRCGRLIEIYEG